MFLEWIDVEDPWALNPHSAVNQEVPPIPEGTQGASFPRVQNGTAL